MTTFFAVWNLMVFLIYGIDKLKAKNGSYRISENFLISCAFFMGAFGAIAGMYIFRHKTRKLKYKLLISLALLINAGVFYYLEMRI